MNDIHQYLAEKLGQLGTEAHNGLSQAYLAFSELHKWDGRGNIAVDRLRGAAKYFDWCANHLRATADVLEEGLKDERQTENNH